MKMTDAATLTGTRVMKLTAEQAIHVLTISERESNAN